MKKKLFLLSVFAFLTLVLTGCSLPFAKKSQAALQVSSVPKATLFLNGEHKGPTPFSDENLKAGEYTLKLVPESSDILLSPWETKLKLTPGVLTVVNYEFGLTEDESAGEILTLETISDKKAAEIAVVSTPDGAVVSLDGEPQGFAPLSLTSIAEGDHLITVSLPGYEERQIKAKTINGYRLSISVQLALEDIGEQPVAADEDASPSADQDEEADLTPTPTPDEIDTTPTPTPKETSGSTPDLDRPYVTIDSPDVGWVRVRKNPCTTEEDRCEELAKANDGESYKFLESNGTGWYKIQYDDDIAGWISGKYAEKYE